MEQHCRKWCFPATILRSTDAVSSLLPQTGPCTASLFCSAEGSHFNPISFLTIQLFWRCLLPPYSLQLIHQAVINLFGNVILFLLIGFQPLPLSEKFHTLWLALLLAAGIMAEWMFLLVGSCDIDDLILNMVSAVISYWLFKFYTNQKQR